jgi:hypothetical protein
MDVPNIDCSIIDKECRVTEYLLRLWGICFCAASDGKFATLLRRSLLGNQLKLSRALRMQDACSARLFLIHLSRIDGRNFREML